MMPSFPQHRLKRKASPGDDTARGLVAPVNPIQEASSGLFDATFDRIYGAMEVDDSEGEELDYYIDKCLLTIENIKSRRDPVEDDDAQIRHKRNRISSNLKLNVEKEEKKDRVAAVAQFDLILRNYERMKRRRSLPFPSDSGPLAESTPETGKVPIIASRQAPDLSRAVPNSFTPPRASAVRLSRSVLARHSVSSSAHSPDSQLFSWVISQLKH
ncbi:unnamed protein product [Rodentolepis nana]|uniref:Uncharacterized protein n=1 Tax=Rodentolepis nana TaxID=102285 RepID=A0A158QJG6_RODNA|nr:unnamed protein product [Rodentolepis nana]